MAVFLAAAVDCFQIIGKQPVRHSMRGLTSGWSPVIWKQLPGKRGISPMHQPGFRKNFTKKVPDVSKERPRAQAARRRQDPVQEVKSTLRFASHDQFHTIVLKSCGNVSDAPYKIPRVNLHLVHLSPPEVPSHARGLAAPGSCRQSGGSRCQRLPVRRGVCAR